MKKLTAWALLISTWFTFVAPVATVNGQVTGRAMEDKMKDVPNGLTFRLSEGAEGAEGVTFSLTQVRCERLSDAWILMRN